MAHIEVPRGVTTDALFRLKKKQGGDLTDDDQYTDGSTASQWPVVVFRTLSGTNVTSSFVKNISGDILPAGWTKHPDPTTGIIREGSTGKYRVRLNPSISLALTDYNWEVTADIGGAPFVETHTVTLIIAGDVEFGAEPVYASEQDVLDNFELETVVVSAQVDKARVSADRRVNAKLQAYNIAVPQDPAKHQALKGAAIAYARGELRRLIAGTTGPGTNVRRLTEGDVTFEFITPDKVAAGMFAEGDEWMELAIDSILGKVYFHSSKMGARSDGRGAW